VIKVSSATNNAIILQLQELLGYRFPRNITRWDEFVPCPTGIHLLDRKLLQGGLPQGHLIEIVGAKSSGKTTLLFHMLSGLNEKERLAAYVDFSQTFYPPSARKSGIDLKKVVILRPESIQAGLRAVEILFRNESICVAAFDLVGTTDQIPRALLLRLRKSIRYAKGIGILLREPDSTKIPGNQLALSLKVERRNQKVLVRTEKSLFGKESEQVELVFDE
jgi:energy-coupling factor transporter ATP-binding protein EcfA2